MGLVGDDFLFLGMYSEDFLYMEIIMAKKGSVVKRVVDVKVLEKLYGQVRDLPDIRLGLMRGSTPGLGLRRKIVEAILAYREEDGSSTVGGEREAERMADCMIEGRRYEVNNVMVGGYEKPYLGPRLSSGKVAEVRDVSKEDRLEDLKPEFNVPEQAE